MTRKLLTKKPFDFSARVTLQLGRESISSSTVAISELLKNSYDADAEHVELNFHLRKNAISTLTIKDDGSGMELESLLNNWMKIGTDNKSINEYSVIKNRVLTGAKGLGRLGIDRLCRKLVLYTKTKDARKAIQLNIDWRRFENTNKSLSEIEHEIFEVSLPLKDKYGDVFLDENSSGTRMLLIGLKDEWTEGYLNKLSNELRLLVSPFQGINDFDVSVLTNVNGTSETKKVSSQEFLELSKWKVEASVNEKGLVSTSFLDRVTGSEIVNSNIPWSEWIKHYGNDPGFGPVQLTFYYIPKDTESLKKIKLKSMDFSRFMELNRGVRIYRDHFRVRPYGEPTGKGDWLDLGYRKAQSPGGIRQVGWRIGPSQIMGAILISREENKILNDQANREGLVENVEFRKLRAFVLKVIETFEYLRYKAALETSEIFLTDELEESLDKFQNDTKSVVQEIRQLTSQPLRGKDKRNLFKKNKIIESKLQQVERTLEQHKIEKDKYISALKYERDKLEEQKDTMSNLASLGILTVCFGHEIRQHSSLAASSTSEVVEHIKDYEKGRIGLDLEMCKSLSVSAYNSLNYIENFSRLALRNITPDKRKKKKINVPSVFEYVFSLMLSTLKTMNIESEIIFINVDKINVNVMAYEIDWESIAFNLITNSLYAFKSITTRRKIEVEFTSVSESMMGLGFRDSGVGLEDGVEELIFMPMHSGRRDDDGNVIGTGMGLAIVKNHIEDHIGGSVRAIKNSRLGGAEFIFVFPVAK